MAAHSEERCAIPSIARAEDAARTGRLRRRVASTDLLFFGGAAVLIGLGWMLGRSDSAIGLTGLLVPASFTALAVVMTLRSNRIGVRRRQVGYVPLAVVSIVTIPWIFLASYVVGALTVLAAGFVVLGWRERCLPLWVTGALGSLLGLVTAAEPVRSRLWSHTATGVVTTGVVTASFGVVVIALAVLTYLAESEELAEIG